MNLLYVALIYLFAGIIVTSSSRSKRSLWHEAKQKIASEAVDFDEAHRKLAHLLALLIISVFEVGLTVLWPLILGFRIYSWILHRSRCKKDQA